MNEELYHHGILGQKWGVRRFQNKNGSLTTLGRRRLFNSKPSNKPNKNLKGREDLIKERTIPAGTKMYRTSSNPKEKLNGPTYVSYTNADRDHYKSGYIRRRDGSNTTYEYEFELNKDLNIPSRKEQQEVVNQVINNNKKKNKSSC